MPFPISINVGDGSAAAVALSSAAIVLVLVLRPIIKKADKAEDLRFYARCALLGALGVLLTGAVCTLMSTSPKEETRTPLEQSEKQVADATSGSGERDE